MGLFSRKDGGNRKGHSEDNHTGSDANFISPTRPSLSTKRGFSSQSGKARPPDLKLPVPPDPNLDPAAYLRSIYAVRERCRLVFEKANLNQLKHFNVDLSKFEDTARFVVSIIKVY